MHLLICGIRKTVLTSFESGIRFFYHERVKSTFHRGDVAGCNGQSGCGVAEIVLLLETRRAEKGLLPF